MKKCSFALILCSAMILMLSACSGSSSSQTASSVPASSVPASSQAETAGTTSSAATSETAVEAPAEPILEFTGSFTTSVGEAKVVMQIGSNGVYAANASHSYGSMDFAAGTWSKGSDGSITLNDVNGNTYTAVKDGSTYVIEGTWDVGSMPAQQLKLTADASAVDAF